MKRFIKLNYSQSRPLMDKRKKQDNPVAKHNSINIRHHATYNSQRSVFYFFLNVAQSLFGHITQNISSFQIMSL